MISLEDQQNQNLASENIPESEVNKKKNKKKEEKGVEQVLKSLHSYSSTEDKLHALCRRYSEVLEDNKTSTAKLKNTQKLLTQLQREKDQLQNEHSKTVLSKSKMEGLCRELQKLNKQIKEESLARAKEEEEKRKEISNKFQTTINEIQKQMTDQSCFNGGLQQENQQLATKLKELCDKYEVREQHIDKVLKSKDLESQLFGAKLQKVEHEFNEEKMKLLKEKQQMLQEAMLNNKKLALYEAQDKQQKLQIEEYAEKFQLYQKSLGDSNQAFSKFKDDMQKMSKKMKKIDKESLVWKQKYETSNKTVLLMLEEKSLQQREVTLLNTKLKRLEDLCRALQAERKKYISTPLDSTAVLETHEVTEKLQDVSVNDKDPATTSATADSTAATTTSTSATTVPNTTATTTHATTTDTSSVVEATDDVTKTDAKNNTSPTTTESSSPAKQPKSCGTEKSCPQ